MNPDELGLAAAMHLPKKPKKNAAATGKFRCQINTQPDRLIL